MMPPEGKLGRKEGNALRLASPIHATNNELCLASKEGEEDASGHGDEVQVTASSQGVRRQPLRHLPGRLAC